MAEALTELRANESHLTVRDLKHLLFRCAATLISAPKVSNLFAISSASFAHSWVQCDYELMKHLVVIPFEVFTPASIATGIEVWTWVISEKPEYEIGVMMEINSAWLATVRFGKGMFSTSQKYSDLDLVFPVY